MALSRSLFRAMAKAAPKPKTGARPAAAQTQVPVVQPPPPAPHPGPSSYGAGQEQAPSSAGGGLIAATSATQGHNSKATELRRDNKTKELDNLGEPHVHLWGSIVHHIIEHGKITSAEKEVLSQHLADAAPKDLEGKVLVARCKEMLRPPKDEVRDVRRQ
eukprot:s6472_g3.t1